MKTTPANHSNANWKPTDKVLFRTPLLPFEAFSRWGQIGGEENTPIEWSSRVDSTRRYLRSMIATPLVSRALFVASPSFFDSLRYWFDDPDSKKGRQAERTLTRYFSRMCTRCTPFGLFSGCSIGQFSEWSDPADLVRLDSSEHIRTKTRIDYEFLTAFSIAMNESPVSEELQYLPNPSLVKVGNFWQYLEEKFDKVSSHYSVVRIADDPFLEAVISAAVGGKLRSELLEKILSVNPEDGPDAGDCKAFVDELISSRVLISELEPRITGESALAGLIEQLDQTPLGAQLAAPLKAFSAALDEMDRNTEAITPQDYRLNSQLLSSLACPINLDRLYQVDMYRPLAGENIPINVKKEIGTGVAKLAAVLGSGESNELRLFRDEFIKRYDRSWVPLSEALDEERGIALGNSRSADPSPLLKGISPANQNAASVLALLPIHLVLLEKILSGEHQTDNIIRLTDEDLAKVPPSHSPLASALCVFCTIVASSFEDVAKDDYQILWRGVGGPSGINMLARFCHLSPEIEKLVSDHIAEEGEILADPETVVAEIVHRPAPRLGNVVSRPVLREYEIPYLGRSGAEPQKQIEISDLLVSVDTSGSIRLYSKRLKKLVIPRLSSAHGYMNPKLPTIYRFLSFLQAEGYRQGFSFSWAGLSTLSSLPRVVYQKHILAPARWSLTSNEIKQLNIKDRALAFDAVQQLRRIRNMPRFVLFSESDQVLAVDLDNPLSVDAWLQDICKLSGASVTEMLPADGQLALSGPEGRFQHELLIPLVASNRSKSSSSEFLATNAIGLDKVLHKKRIVLPSEEWFYVKVYGAPSDLEQLLLKDAATMSKSLFNDGLISSWFFIRYADPYEHLRLRFQITGPEVFSETTSRILRILSKAVKEHCCDRLTCDTYEREFERYGGPQAMETVERIFSADSSFVTASLNDLDDEIRDNVRWKIAFLGINRFLDDLEIDYPRRRSIISNLRRGLSTELSVTSEADSNLSSIYRSEKSKSFHSSLLLETNELGQVKDRLDEYSSQISLILRSDRHRYAAEIIRNDESIIGSILHMHVNRVFKQNQRRHEFALYTLLGKTYAEREARIRRETVVQEQTGD